MRRGSWRRKEELERVITEQTGRGGEDLRFIHRMLTPLQDSVFGLQASSSISRSGAEARRLERQALFLNKKNQQLVPFRSNRLDTRLFKEDDHMVQLTGVCDTRCTNKTGGASGFQKEATAEVKRTPAFYLLP